MGTAKMPAQECDTIIGITQVSGFIKEPTKGRLNFPRQTLCDWVEKGAEWLQAIVREMKRELLAGDYLQVDETPVRVMDPEVKGRCATGYLWVAGVPGGDVIFEFHPGRGKEYAQQLMGDFQGYLQRDGYGVYSSLAKGDEGLIGVGCWAQPTQTLDPLLIEASCP
jgi:hypothetical protein